MTKTRLKSIRAVEREWKRLLDWSIDTSDLLAYATSGAKRFITPDQYRAKIILLEVDQYETLIPDDFALICQAAYSLFPDEKHYIKQVSQWTHKALNDCELEINLKCDECETDGSILEIPVDEMVRTSSPEIYSYMDHYYRHGGITDYKTKCFYHPQFYLMRPRQGWFSNLDYHIKGCINLNIQDPISYEIVDGEKMVVNFKKGQVLLSYLGWPVDEEGLIMVPDVEEAWEAIVYFIAERESFSQYMTDPSRNNERRWSNMVAKRAEWIGRARMKLRVPDPDQYEAMLSNHWNKLVPYNNSWDNSNMFQKDTFNIRRF